jgi:hypothetical protein
LAIFVQSITEARSRQPVAAEDGMLGAGMKLPGTLLVSVSVFIRIVQIAFGQPHTVEISLDVTPDVTPYGEPVWVTATVRGAGGFPLDGTIQWRDVYLNMNDFGDSDLGRTPLMLQPAEAEWQQAVSRVQFPNLELGGHTVYAYYQPAQQGAVWANVTSAYIRVQEQRQVQGQRMPYPVYWTQGR